MHTRSIKHSKPSRREVLMACGAGAAGLALGNGCTAERAEVPSYLEDFRDLCAQDPHQAAIEWFRAARFGLFMHYGLYSIPGGEWKGKEVVHLFDPDRPVAEWIQFHGKIPVAEYAKLKDEFTAEKFDADHVTDVALVAEMKYVNITTRHHDSFCLFRTNETDFNSVNSPAKRDLVAELAEQCQKKKLGLFLYYSHGRDWRHPHAPALEWGRTARPPYEQPQPEYIDDAEVDIGKYVAFMERQITELLTQYGPVAGIWLDGEGILKGYAAKLPGGLEEVIGILKLKELYAMIRRLQPQCLISYKKGVTMTEDFLTPEREGFDLHKLGKPLEINTTLQAHSWGYNKFSQHRKSVGEIMETLASARELPANLLLNTGPMGDGSLVPEEEATLREIGEQLRRSG